MTGRINIFILFLFLLLPSTSNGQFSESFSDGDFTFNPVWVGDESKFTIDNFRLKLLAPPSAGTAYLSTSSSAINDAAWEFTVQLDFNPSSSNYCRVYLVADQGNLSGPLNGYFVQIGDTPDEISLYKQSGTSLTKIIDGSDGTVNLSIVNVAVKVTRDAIGNWTLYSDVGVTGSFSTEGIASDNTFNASSYFGVYCNYTSTRSDKFYFDNFTVSGDPYQDLDPPIIHSIEVLSSVEMNILFNEVVESASAANPNNYLLMEMGEHPTNVALAADGLSVKLLFSNPFQNGKRQTIAINGIKDLAGNSSNNNYSFLFFQPVPVKYKDIIITEIFADPTPQVALPDSEFIELFNRSNHPFNLLGWELSDGSSKAVFPEKIILPGEYWIVCANSNVSKFGLTANVLGVPNFPTLNNTTDTLTLKTSGAITIDSLNYNLSWYRNIDKQEGGWSLELIDPNNICAEEGNWSASENQKGGTPGNINSVFANKPDLTSPLLVSISPIDSYHLLLSFNEKLESPISGSVSFSLIPSTQVVEHTFNDKSLRSILLTLATPLSPKQLYSLAINNLFDCSGNNIAPDTKFEFALPEKAAEGDIIINEILFNPKPNGVDFVELYNKSDKYINLKNWKIGNINNDNIINEKILTNADLIFPPGEYLVLTADPIILKINYPQSVETNFLSTTMPSFPDDSGSVAILNNDTILIDYFTYDKKYHSEFIKDPEGVSLERISFSQKTNDRQNWASASATSGFATPGYINSNFRSQTKPIDDEIHIYPTVFIPQSGGFEFSQITFKFDQSGFVANVKILDHQGRLIKTIANNATLSHEGFFRWDGDMEDGNLARSGYYVVWFEVFDTRGNIKTYRKRVVIAAR